MSDGTDQGREWGVDVGLLGAALLFLPGAAVCSILAGATRGRFSLAAVKDMRRMLSDELWPISEVDARNYTAQLNLLAIRTLRAGNAIKYRFLVLALALQALGILLLAGFAVVVLAT